MIENKPLSDSENEESATKFLQTNGPPKWVFEANVPPALLKGKSEDVIWLYEEVSKGNRMKEWTCQQIVGLKQAHRAIHNRMDAVKEELSKEIAKTAKEASEVKKDTEDFVAWWKKWVNAKNVIVGAIVLPLVPLLIIEIVKLFILKHLGIKP